VWYNGQVVEQYKRKANAICVICGKAVYKRPIQIQNNKKGVFCGSVCFGYSCRKENPCLVCGELILAGLNKKTCSRACANKNRKGVIYKIGRPHDKLKDMRSIKESLFRVRDKKCERCGFNICKILQVHHKDRNRKNNATDNLEVLCPNCHAKEHYMEKI